MAPKAKQAKRKRPASAASAGVGPPRKKPAGRARDSGLTASECMNVVAHLEGVGELPQDVRKMLADLMSHSIGNDCSILAEMPYVAAVGNALADIEHGLIKWLRTARAQVEGAEADHAGRIAAQSDAMARLGDLKQIVQDMKSALNDSAKAIAAAQQDLEHAKRSQKCSQADLKAIASKRAQLEATCNVYQPLTAASAGGPEGQKVLKNLRKVGKEFGFHDVLLDAIPAILRKQPEKRRTFDNLGMKQFEAELEKHASVVETVMRHDEASLQECAVATEEARTALKAAQERWHTITHSLAEARAAVLPAKEAVTTAQRRLRAFTSDMQKLTHNLGHAEARLNAFRAGPLATFDALQSAMVAKGSVAEEEEERVPSMLPADSIGTSVAVDAAMRALNFPAEFQAPIGLSGSSFHTQEDMQSEDQDEGEAPTVATTIAAGPASAGVDASSDAATLAEEMFASTKQLPELAEGRAFE